MCVWGGAGGGMSVGKLLVILGGARGEQTAQLSFSSQLVLIQDVFCSNNCVELSHRGLGYMFWLQLYVQQHFTSLIVLFLAAWDTGGAFRRSNKMAGG